MVEAGFLVAIAFCLWRARANGELVEAERWARRLVRRNVNVGQ